MDCSIAPAGASSGPEHYLTKPFTKDELLNAIETHVGAVAWQEKAMQRSARQRESNT